MKNIMNKIAQFLANQSNATKIRNGMTVRKRLELINLLMGICLVCFMALYIVAHLLKTMFAPAIITAACFLCIALWFYGLRKAVATSQQARQDYIRESTIHFRRVCKKLGECFWVIAMVGAGVTATVVALALYIKLGAVPENILTLLPSLEPLADSTITQLNVVLEKLLAYIS